MGFRKAGKAEVEVGVEIKVIQDHLPDLHPRSTGKVKVTPHPVDPSPTAAPGAAATLLPGNSTTARLTKLPR